jgi:hypothetical protein
MALKADQIREIVEKNTHDPALNLVTGATDWQAVAVELNEEVMRQLDEAGKKMSDPAAEAAQRRADLEEP